MYEAPLSLLSIPAPDARSVVIRLRLADSTRTSWREAQLFESRKPGWWNIDLRNLGLTDGDYEYEFMVVGGDSVKLTADPYAEELTAGEPLRSVLHIYNGERVRPAFSWDQELPESGLPANNELVIYELPVRPSDGSQGAATLDSEMFEQLEARLSRLGVNCIQMLPVQDSPDALNGGYGTRFFFAPDRSIGTPLALRTFIKRCHQKGIRVFMDLVMNHARECPLRELAFDWFFLRDGNEELNPNGVPRPRWGGDIFRYRNQAGGGFHARDLQYRVAAFFISEYHVDGFRIDEFQGIDNYEFIQAFRDRAHALQSRLFHGKRPFLVIAEDSSRRAKVTTSAGYRGRSVVDAIWDFSFREEIRQLVSDSIEVKEGEPGRGERVRRLLTVGCPGIFAPPEYEYRFFKDLTNRIAYCTSHDVPGDEHQRLMPYFIERLQNKGAPESLAEAMVHSIFALMLTAAGIPMFLAGEELGERSGSPASERHSGDLVRRVKELVRLRITHPALHRNELTFFGFSTGTANEGFHPSFDDRDGEKLFAYCRTGREPLGSAGQVVVVANLSQRAYHCVEVEWPWDSQVSALEVGGTASHELRHQGCRAFLALRPFETRIFKS